jgi:hypothetical protein
VLGRQNINFITLMRATALMQIKIQPFVKLIARADELIE